ncbi:MAG: GspH/FimT family pseudopilin [Planctomycetota bacterium]|nr:GspH/FimT family pseudopilin [Planctomycetota bacterium]
MHQRGFTLLELLAVVLIMGTVLLLVPISLENVGAQGKLKNTANSLVAAMNGGRERAILDAHEVYLEIGGYQDDDSEEWRQGWRFKFTNVPAQDISETEDEGERERRRAARARDREWLYSGWHAVPRGVEIAGVSTQKGAWRRAGQGGKPIPIRFFADGTVESAVAIRIENVDMEVNKEYRTLTVIVNGLTSEASWVEGLGELTESLPSSNFGN